MPGRHGHQQTQGPGPPRAGLAQLDPAHTGHLRQQQHPRLLAHLAPHGSATSSTAAGCPAAPVGGSSSCSPPCRCADDAAALAKSSAHNRNP